jgi:hypothetical protein
MKKIIRMMSIYASLAIAAVVFANAIESKAQTPTPSPAQTPAAAQGQCTDEIKNPLYTQFTQLRTTDPIKAYEPAKKYLAACPAEESQITSYLKKWVLAYDKEARKVKLKNLFLEQKKYADALPVAKEILTEEPDHIPALFALGYGGYVLAVSTKNESGNAEAINYAKKAIQAIESGKAPESWSPFKSKDDALGYLYYSIGYLERVTNPADALTNFIKAAQFESDIKKNSQTYAFISNAYESEYAKQSAEYEKNFKDKPETPESKLAAENINQLVDRIIDALARAVAVAGTDANAQTAKTQWLARLTELYKFRHNQSDAGLNEMIASVMSKPLPPVPTPITTLPAAAPTTTTTPTSGNLNSSPAATATPVSATNTTTAPSTTSLTAAPKTAAATTASSTAKVTTSTAKNRAKPKTRNNHRRRH